MRYHPVVLLVLVLSATACSTMFDSEETTDEHTAGFHVQNAQRLYDGGHYAKALQQFEKALVLEDENKAALLGQGWCLLNLAEGRLLLGERDAADFLARAETAFREMKEEINFGENTYKVDLGVGKVHVLYGDLYSARADLLRRRALRRVPSPAEKQALDSTLASAAKEYDAAESVFETILAQETNMGADDNLVALVHLTRISVIQKNYSRALIYSEKYLRQVELSKELWVAQSIQYPENRPIWEAKLAGAVTKEVEVRDLVADILFKLGRYELAEQELSEVIFLSPERGDAYLNRGIVRERLGRKDDALEDYRSFLLRAARLDLSPEDARVLMATERIIALEKELGLPSSIKKKTASK